MTRATRGIEYTRARAETLYLAFELGLDDWKVGFTTQLGAKPRLRVMPARDLERLRRGAFDHIRDGALADAALRLRAYRLDRAGGGLAPGETLNIEYANVDGCAEVRVTDSVVGQKGLIGAAPGNLYDDLLDFLRPGDILTHAYSGADTAGPL